MFMQSWGSRRGGSAVPVGGRARRLMSCVHRGKTNFFTLQTIKYDGRCIHHATSIPESNRGNIWGVFHGSSEP